MKRVKRGNRKQKKSEQDRLRKLRYSGAGSVEDFLNVSLMDWINYHQRRIVGFQCRWLGHRTLKNPLDAWIYQEMLYEIRPDIILEIGNKNGGSALYLATICDALRHGKIIAVDICHDKMTAKHPRIVTVTGDSKDPAVVRRVHKMCKERRTLIIHDGDHSREGVLTDMRNYSGLIQPPSYFIIEDTTDGLPHFLDQQRENPNSPLAAIREFLLENRRFQIDKTRERYLLTANFNGFLKCATPESF